MILKVKSFLKESSWMMGLVLFIGLVCFWSRSNQDQERKKPPRPQPLADQVLRRGTTHLSQINPYRTGFVSEVDVARDLFEGLTTYNLQGQAVGSMAESWEHDKTGKVWTFYLRPEAQWSDGSPVTAHDFVASWRMLCTRENIGPSAHGVVELMLKTSFPLVNGWKCYEEQCTPDQIGVEAVDNRTLRVRFTIPQSEGPLLERLTDAKLLPIPPQSIEILGATRGPRDFSACLCNGPFRITEFKPNDRAVLKKNSHYWDAVHVKIVEVIYHACDGEDALIQAWVDGSIDLMRMDQALMKRAEMIPFRSNQYWVPAKIASYFLLNLRDPHLAKDKVRLALNMLMERENWEKECSVPCSSLVVYGVLEKDQSLYKEVYADWIELPRCERVKRAQALLEEEGYTQANPLSFEVRYEWPDGSFQIAVARDWSLPNLKVSLTPINPDERKLLRRSRQYQVILDPIAFTTWSPLGFFQQFSRGGDNASGYNDPNYDDRVTQLQGENDPEVCQQLTLELEGWLLKDMPMLPWAYRYKPWVVREEVRGLPLWSKGVNPAGAVYSKHLSIHKSLYHK